MIRQLYHQFPLNVFFKRTPLYQLLSPHKPATGVLVRCHLVSGQLSTAQGLLTSFRAKAERENAAQLMDNLSAFEAWLSLYSGDGSRADANLLTAPDEHQEFCTLDRYRIITKIRCLIAKGQLAKALDSALSMDEYFVSYGRHYLWMENQLLQAIILYRQGDTHWQRVLTDGLKMAEYYHFVRIVALEGSAVQSLLENLRTDEISPKFLKALRQETSKMALQYPDYLHYEALEAPALTPQEQRVLSMLCTGKSTEAICQECGITYSGLKFHNRKIYKKLGITSRAAAERAALRLGIVHRG
jgi:LuxR family maltose regulon positive regulatory protein